MGHLEVVQQASGLLNEQKFGVDAASHNERALVHGDQWTDMQCEPERERFGKVLREEMDEADGPEIIE